MAPGATTEVPTVRGRPDTHYHRMIVTALAVRGDTLVDPRHVEAWMRAGNSTLDHLKLHAFLAELELAIVCMAHAGARESERLARSFGL